MNLAVYNTFEPLLTAIVIAIFANHNELKSLHSGDYLIADSIRSFNAFRNLQPGKRG